MPRLTAAQVKELPVIIRRLDKIDNTKLSIDDQLFLTYAKKCYAPCFPSAVTFVDLFKSLKNAAKRRGIEVNA